MILNLLFYFTTQNSNYFSSSEYTQFSKATGKYIQDDFVDFNKIQPSCFTYKTDGDKENHSISIAFDNMRSDRNFWVAQYPNNDTFYNSIYITFDQRAEIKAILHDYPYSTNTHYRNFSGFPLITRIYKSFTDDDQMELQATFSGDLPIDMAWTRTQLIFKNPIICKRLQIEFVKVSPDFSFSNGAECPVINKIYFIGTLLHYYSYYYDQNSTELSSYKTNDKLIKPKSNSKFQSVSLNPKEDFFTNSSFINNNFTGSFGYDQIQAGTNEFNIFQISGCRFTDIISVRNYYIRLHSEILFFDNVFEDTEIAPNDYNRPSIIWCSYNGPVTISNCKFIRITGRGIEGFVITANGINQVNLTLEKCEFIDCGKEINNLPLITLLGDRSMANFIECNFTFTDPSRSFRVLDIYNNDVMFDRCRFIQCGENAIHLTKYSYGNYPLGTFQFTNNYVASNTGNFINGTQMSNKPIIENNVFENITMMNSYLIYILHNVEQIELINNTFSKITTSKTSELYGGGIATLIGNLISEFTIKYEKCRFYDIINNKNTAPYYQGGAIQYGFSSYNINTHIEIIECEFKRNQAKHHGGAIFIQTSKNVTIVNCEFESNIANSDKNESVLLFYNYYDMKNKGFGGAIFLNPSFNFEGQDYCMSYINISHCLFKNNKAYQGYDIYIEGDYCFTSFVINDNEFINNNSESIPYGRGIVASEIFSIDKEEIESSNDFSKVQTGTNIERFIYVDHYGNRIPDATPSPAETPSQTQILYEADIIEISHPYRTNYLKFNCPVQEGSMKIYVYCEKCNKLPPTNRSWFKVYFKGGNIENVEYENKEIHNNDLMNAFVPRDEMSYDLNNSTLTFFIDSVNMHVDETMTEKDLKCHVPPITAVATVQPTPSASPSLAPLPAPDQSVMLNHEGLINLTCDKFLYSGNWGKCVENFMADYGSFTYEAGSKARVNFIGVKVHLLAMKETTSGSAYIRIDDQLVAILDFTSENQENYKSIIFTSNDLIYGEHTFEIESINNDKSIVFASLFVDPLPKPGGYILGFADFKEKVGSWVVSTDTPPVFSSSGEYASGVFEFYGTRFWLTGVRSKNFGDFELIIDYGQPISINESQISGFAQNNKPFLFYQSEILESRYHTVKVQQTNQPISLINLLCTVYPYEEMPTLTPAATPTNSPVATPTNSPVASPTNSPLATPTNSPLATPTNSPLATPTNSPLATPTNSPLATPTNSPVASPTNSPLATPTNSPLATPTNSPLATPTNSPVATPTNSPVATPTNSPVATPTNSPVATPTPSLAATPSTFPVETPTHSPFATPTPSLEPIIKYPEHISSIIIEGNHYSITFDCLIYFGSVKFYLKCTNSESQIKEGLYFQVFYENKEINRVEFDPRTFILIDNDYYSLSHFVQVFDYNKVNHSIVFDTGSSFLILTEELIEAELYCFATETPEYDSTSTYPHAETPTYSPESTPIATPIETSIFIDADIINNVATGRNNSLYFSCPIQEGSVRIFVLCLSCDQINSQYRTWFQVSFKNFNIEKVEYDDQPIQDTMTVEDFVPRQQIVYNEETSILKYIINNTNMIFNSAKKADELKCNASPKTFLYSLTSENYQTLTIDSAFSNEESSENYKVASIIESTITIQISSFNNEETYIHSLSGSRYTDNNHIQTILDKSKKSNKTIGIVCGIVAALVAIVAAVVVSIVLIKKKNGEMKNNDNHSPSPEIVVDDLSNVNYTVHDSEDNDLNFWL